MLAAICNMVADVLDAVQVIQDMALAVLLVVDALLLVALLDSLSQNLQEVQFLRAEGVGMSPTT